MAPDYESDMARNKKVWNFVKGDISKLLSDCAFDMNVQVSITEDKSFLVDYQANKSSDNYVIGYDFSFAHSLHIDNESHEFMALMLAIVSRLQRTYKGAFSVKCDYYPIVARANEMLLNSLGMRASHNWLSTFVEYPTPGRKPLKDKPITSSEAMRRSMNKKRRSGKARLSSWVDNDIKSQLDDYCKKQGCTIEKALADILPLGLNISAYLNNKNDKGQNKAI